MASPEECIENHFKQYLRLKGYRTIQIPIDSNCLYNALAKAVMGDGDMAKNQMKLRRRVKSYILNNRETFVNYFQINEQDMDDEEIEYARNSEIDKITDGDHGGEHTFIAVCSMYQRSLIVEKPLQGQVTYQSEQIRDSPIFISCDKNGHYNLLEMHPDGPSTDEVAIDENFREYLRLKNYLITEVPKDSNSLYAAFSIFKRGSTEHQMDIRRQIKFFVIKHKNKYRDQIIKILLQQPSDPDEDDMEDKVDNYIEQITDPTKNGDEFIVEIASSLFRKTFVVERPLQTPLRYPKIGPGINSAVCLSNHFTKFFNFLTKQTTSTSASTNKIESETEGIDEENVLDYEEIGLLPFIVDPSVPEDSQHERFILLRSVYHRAINPVMIAFLVPGKNLEYRTLAEAWKNIPSLALDHIKHVVVYSKGYMKKQLLTDRDLRLHYTLYTHTFRTPPGPEYYNRMAYLAHLIVPPLLLNLDRYSINGTEFHSLFNHDVHAIPHTLFEHYWSTLGEEIKQAVAKIKQSENASLLCDGCSESCNLQSIPCHYDMRLFLKKEYKPVSTVTFLSRYDLFEGYGKNLSTTAAEMYRLHHSRSSNALELFYKFLDDNTSHCEYSTYMVLHIDGPNVDKYTYPAQYYEMLTDKTNLISIYVGSTTNMVIREAHFNDARSTLNSVLTRTSKLFLLRHKSFEQEDLARKDEAMIIEIIITRLLSLKKKQVQPNFLFLNVMAAYVKLLPDALTSTPNLYAEFCAGDIPIFKSDRSDKRSFENGNFKGNFLPQKEVKLFGGQYKRREFRDMDDVYHRIRGRQP